MEAASICDLVVRWGCNWRFGFHGDIVNLKIWEELQSLARADGCACNEYLGHESSVEDLHSGGFAFEVGRAMLPPPCWGNGEVASKA